MRGTASGVCEMALLEGALPESDSTRAADRLDSLEEPAVGALVVEAPAVDPDGPALAASWALMAVLGGRVLL